MHDTSWCADQASGRKARSSPLPTSSVASPFLVPAPLGQNPATPPVPSSSAGNFGTIFCDQALQNDAHFGALTCGVLATGPSALAIESCGMPSKRSVLELLNRAELLSFLDLAGLSVIDRRKKELLVDALSGSRRARLSDYLATFSRARLQGLCRGVGVDDSGREKAVLIDRITGGKAPSTLRGRAAE